MFVSIVGSRLYFTDMNTIPFGYNVNCLSALMFIFPMKRMCKTLNVELPRSLEDEIKAIYRCIIIKCLSSLNMVWRRSEHPVIHHTFQDSSFAIRIKIFEHH